MAEELPKHIHSLFNHHKKEDDGPVDYEKEEKHHKHEEHASELAFGALTAGAFALVRISNSFFYFNYIC